TLIMKIVSCIFFAAITICLIIVLNIQLPAGVGKTPRLGFFLSPQTGFWQNAEPADIKYNANLHFDNLSGKAEVYFDERLVPHVFAENENDVYFIQGYLHAKFRLWQMEFQTQAAAGRLSEIMGDSTNGTNFLKIDKFFRRLGMVYAAENSLKALEEDTETKAACDAYTKGVNACINSLTEKNFPVEYKLLNYKPELWTNLKTALLLKYMSFDLAGHEEDFERTNAKAFFTKEQYKKLFPIAPDSLDPIIPKNTLIPKSKFEVHPPASADSLYIDYKTIAAPESKPIKPHKYHGSNNWAVAGSKTKSGSPILCNDPHLGLNLPSLWYEMQLSTPQFNTYGVSFPGAPTIIIGFNDNCAWGFTNAERDVRDYYEVQFRDSAMNEYFYDSAWQKTEWRNEIIKIKGKPNDTEHIAMTIWGPVMYDKNYPDKLNRKKSYACRWKAHDKSDELKTFYKLDHAKNYADYLDAISTFQCPGQNMIFAAKSGDIAIRQQGQFPAKWYRQGEFIMPGTDSSFAWQGYIPDSMNITMHNPARGFVSSANQRPYDTSYPYYLNGTFLFHRGYLINRQLSSMQNITPEDMETLQTSYYNLRAEMARPIFLKYLDTNFLNDGEKKYLDILTSWNLQNDAHETGATVFTVWLDSLMATMYNDEFKQSSLPMPWPDESTMIDGIAKDTTYEFADNINTAQKESIGDVVTSSFKKAVQELKRAEQQHRLEWGKFKDGGVTHLLKLQPFSRPHLYGGGGEGIINAFEKNHGPSWRMIVELTDDTHAYGVYPGGQSGNPGSKYYDNFIDYWLTGKYYPLHLLKKEAIEKQPKLLGKITFSKS
ncbi:MAG: penicillin acylase family protein, partial [Parafilimonas sp.]